MWYHRHKIASIHGWSKGITHLRSAAATYYTPSKAYYGDYNMCFKAKKDPNFIKCISQNFVKPRYELEESKSLYHLAPHDLVFLPFNHIHFGLLFSKPTHIKNQEFSINSYLESLKKSLSQTLVHFYPLAGRLVIEVDEDKHESIVYVDCNKGPGARFIHAAALDMTISDILSPKHVPLVVRSFFDLNEESVNYNDHSKPLLSVQVTELEDGVFIACSVSHCITDGASYWQFWNIWSKIHRGGYNGQTIVKESDLPVYTRWYPEGRAPGSYPIPFTHPDEFVTKFDPPQLSDRIFHFSSESVARLKAKANEEGYEKNISSYQSLCALVWRSMVKANGLSHDQITHNHIAANSRKRLDTPLPEYYFGNFVQLLTTTTTAGELLENNLGWAASLLHQSVVNFNYTDVHDFVNQWLKSPNLFFSASILDRNNVAVINSPRFDMYGNEFGLGKALAFRTGHGNKGVGLVYACPGCEGGESVDLEICLPPDSMDALELDKEFMAFVSML